MLLAPWHCELSSDTASIYGEILWNYVPRHGLRFQISIYFENDSSYRLVFNIASWNCVCISGVAKDAVDMAGCVPLNDKFLSGKLIEKGVAVVMA